METDLFSPDDVAVLRDVNNWSFISSSFPSRMEPVSQPEYEAWVAENKHSHEHQEVLIVLSGSGYQQHSGKTYAVGPGTVLLFDSMEPHAQSYPPDQPLGKHLFCCFYADTCGFNLVSTGGENLVEHSWLQWRHEISLLQLGFAGEKALFPKVEPGIPVEWVRWLCGSALEMLVASMLVESHQSEVDSHGHGFHEHIAKAMLRYIEEHNGCDCSLEKLARIAGYSTGYFARLFKEHVGKSVQESVTAARVQGFRVMLAQRLPQKIIAERLGFAHQSTLCRWRRQMGI